MISPDVVYKFESDDEAKDSKDDDHKVLQVPPALHRGIAILSLISMKWQEKFRMGSILIRQKA
jgi:hypothetical protein